MAEDRAEAGDRRVRIMGVVNVTPDSFSDGGLFLDPERGDRARARAGRARGRTSSTSAASRPAPAPRGRRRGGASRVEPVIAALAGDGPGVPISIDTSKAAVAAAALDAGATIVNDITAFRADQEIAALVRRARRGRRA